MAGASQAEVSLKQLCCSGLGGEALIPPLLGELARLVPNHSSTFMWCGSGLQVANMYDPNPVAMEVAPLYFAEFYNSRERETHRDFVDGMRSEWGVKDFPSTLTVDLQTYRRSDHYNLIMRPMGYSDTRRIAVRDGGRPLGSLNVWRGPGAAPFTGAEERMLARLEPFIAHALDEPRELEVELVPDGRTAMAIADGDGRLLHLSGAARHLLTLACNPQIAPRRLAREPAALPPALVCICRDLVALGRGRDASAPPVHRHRNAWGGFVFRAYRLEPASPGPCLVGVTIEHEEPLPVRLSRGLHGLPLAARQAEVCLLMAQGLTYAEIAGRLDISRHTAVATARRVYDKLGLSTRGELREALLARADQGPPHA